MSLEEVVERAADFHGHLGPFLVIGVRMGLIGLKKLGLKQHKKQLSITASLPLHVPFSCMIDGLQVATKCTMGNQKLSIKDSEEIQAEFRREDSGQRIAVALNKASFEKLKAQLLQKDLSDEKVRELARKVATTPEEELFVTTQQPLLKNDSSCPQTIGMEDLQIAKKRMKERKETLVFVSDSKVIFETKTEGLEGFLQAIDQLDGRLSGASVADKTIGQAAALLCTYAHVAAAFAVTLSKNGLDTLSSNKIQYEYENLVPTILNRQKTGKCPFEKLVENIADPNEAYLRIKHSCSR